LFTVASTSDAQQEMPFHLATTIEATQTGAQQCAPQKYRHSLAL
jgi:hypothetical protein